MRNARLLRFTVVLNDEERRLLDSVATRLARSRGDTLRFLLKEVDRGLALDAQPEADDRASA